MDASDEAKLGDRYRLGERLGAGQVAEVYAATDLLLGRPVAVKVLRTLPDPAAERRALRAAQAAARIQVQHRNVIPVLDVHGGRPGFLVLGIIKGRRLSDVLATRLRDQEARAIADGLLAGLAALHQAGLIHRGVSADNVLVDTFGVPRVTCAGLAEASVDPGLGLRPNEGQTPREWRAASPEQEMELAATARSDVFGAGRVVQALLPTRSPAEDRVLQIALEEDPAQRFRDAGIFREALREAFPVARAAPAVEVVTAPAAAQPDTGKGWRYGLLAVLAGMALALAAVFVLRDDRPVTAPAEQAAAASPPVAPAVTPSPSPSIEESALAALIAAAEQDPEALGVGGRALLPRLQSLEGLEDEQRAAEVASLYGAFVVGAARGSVDPAFADQAIEALWPEVTVESLLAMIASDPDAAGERGPTLLGALRDLVSTEDTGSRLTKGADLGLVAAEWAQQGTLTDAVAATAVTALMGIPGGDAQTTETTVEVPAADQWTDTGIDVPAGGIVIVSATGEVSHDSSSTAGPVSATDAPELRQFNVVPEIDHAALLGRVGEEGDPFFVGTDAVFPVGDGGRLYLGVNDEGTVNNEGAFQVIVTVWGA